MTARPEQPPRRKRRWLRRLAWSLAVVALLLAGGLAAVYFAATSAPGWYEPASIDYSLLEQDKTTIVALTERVTKALHEGKPVEVSLDQAQINRWLAGRLELWPETGDVLPNEVSRPQVRVEPNDRLRIGATLTAGGVRSVVDLSLAAQVTAETLRIELASLRLGVLPTPVDLLERMVPDDLYEGLRLRDGGADVRNEFSLPNSRRRFGVTRIRTEGDSLIVTLTPK